MNDGGQFSGARKGEDTSSFCKTEEGYMMKDEAEKRISENVQEVKKCDCNNIVSSEGSSDISKLPVEIGETSFNLENNDQNLTENLSACIKKDCDKVIYDKKEFESISEDMNLLKTNSVASSSTQCKDSNEESNKINLLEHESELKETEQGCGEAVKPSPENKALLELFHVNNTLSRKLLWLLLDSEFKNGATLSSVLNHIRDDVPGPVTKLREEIKYFFKTAVTAGLVEMKARRYFLKLKRENENETKNTKESANKKPYTRSQP